MSRETISKITDEIVADMAVWQNRPLDAVYPVLLIDAITVKVRDAQVANRPVYVAIGVNLQGERDVLGLWLGPTGGEGAKAWVTMLTELRNRGLADSLIVCCDTLRGPARRDPRHLAPGDGADLRGAHGANSLRYASKKHWGQITRPCGRSTPPPPSRPPKPTSRPSPPAGNTEPHRVLRRSRGALDFAAYCALVSSALSRNLPIWRGASWASHARSAGTRI